MERRRRGKRPCMEWLECSQVVVRKWVVDENEFGIGGKALKAFIRVFEKDG